MPVKPLTFSILGRSYVVALPPPPRVPEGAVAEETRDEDERPQPEEEKTRFASGVFLKQER